MLKSRSLSTENGGEHNILFATLSCSGNMLRWVFHHLRGSTSFGSSGRQQIYPVHFSESVFVNDDLRAFFFFEVCFSLFVTADASDDKSRVEVVHVNRRVTASRVYIIQIFDLWDQSGIRATERRLNKVWTRSKRVLAYLHHRVG